MFNTTQVAWIPLRFGMPRIASHCGSSKACSTKRRRWCSTQWRTTQRCCWAVMLCWNFSLTVAWAWTSFEIKYIHIDLTIELVWLIIIFGCCCYLLLLLFVVVVFLFVVIFKNVKFNEIELFLPPHSVNYHAAANQNSENGCIFHSPKEVERNFVNESSSFAQFKFSTQPQRERERKFSQNCFAFAQIFVCFECRVSLYVQK